MASLFLDLKTRQLESGDLVASGQMWVGNPSSHFLQAISRYYKQFTQVVRQTPGYPPLRRKRGRVKTERIVQLTMML
jgi:hypothetical protein